MCTIDAQQSENADKETAGRYVSMFPINMNVR